MLQQTRVEAVVPYYERFLDRFPTVQALASAPRQEVLAMWAGLGYYRRARMLHEAAGRVANDHGGRLPRDYRALRALPGIGEYTAAAIASIAFDQPRAALDGNAYRVLARLADDRREIRSADCRRGLQALAGSLVEAVPVGQRGAFTQSLMELGSGTCVPRAPRCTRCPWARDCAGFAAGSAPGLPVKGPRKPSRRVEISILVIRQGGRVLVRRRPDDASIMPGFWELPTVEGGIEALRDGGFESAVRGRRLGAFAHAITNTNYDCGVYEAQCRPPDLRGFRWMDSADLHRMPLSTISRKAIRFATGLASSSGRR